MGGKSIKHIKEKILNRVIFLLSQGRENFLKHRRGKWGRKHIKIGILN